MGPSGGTAAGYASTSLGTTGPEDPVHIYAATSHPLLHYKVGKNTKAKNRPYSPMRPRNTPYPTKSKCQTPEIKKNPNLVKYPLPKSPVRCANRPFYTPQSPKPRPGARNCLNAVHAVQSAQPEAPRKTLAPPIGVRISPFAHRKALAQKYVNSSGTA